MMLIRRVTGRRALIQAIGRGTLLYHGTSAEEDFTELADMAWVSDSSAVALEFAGWNGGTGQPRILTYRVSQTIPLLARVITREDMEKLAREMDESSGGPHELAEEVCGWGQGPGRSYEGWIVRGNYADGGHDIMLCDPMRWLAYVSTEYL